MSSFDKVVGYDAIKAEFFQIIDMIKNPEYYKRLGARLPKGALLNGRPGTGKTLLCKCFIEEAGIPAYTVRRDSGDEDFINKITQAFADAKEHAPSIVFLDDMDKFANEGKENKNCPEYVAVQSGIDACKDCTVFALATTNDDDFLPESLVRTGRFDRYINVPIPSDEDAVQILKYYMQDKNIDPDLNLDDVVKMTGSDVCSVLETVMNESAIHAAYERSEYIKMNHILNAVLRLTYNCPDNTTNVDKEEVELRACHEAGHIVIAEALEPNSIGLASIRSTGRSNSGGFIHKWKSEYRRPHNILISLAGKVATELNYPKVASGCNSDLQRAFNDIAEGITENATCGYQYIETYKDNSAQLTHDQEIAVRSEVERYSTLARNIIIANREFLDKLRTALLEKETLLYSDIQAIRNECTITQFSV